MAVVRFIIGALGALATTIGIILIAIAVGLTTWIGADETVELPEIHITATDGTIVAGDFDFLWDEPRFAPELGRIDLRLRTSDGSPLFAGIGNRLDVDRLVFTEGDPSESAVWIVSDEGDVARVQWDAEPGDWSLFVAADDGDEIVIDGEVTAAEFRLAAITVGGIGVASAVAGTLMLIVAFTSGRRRVDATQEVETETETIPV